MSTVHPAKGQSQRRLRDAGRPRVAAIAWVVLAAQLTSMTHLALVQHAVCLEHGEFIHAESADQASILLHEQEPSPGVSVESSASALADADDHCAVLAHRREQKGPEGWTSHPAPLMHRAGHLPWRGEPAKPSFALYRLVPKQSPPA